MDDKTPMKKGVIEEAKELMEASLRYERVYKAKYLLSSIERKEKALEKLRQELAGVDTWEPEEYRVESEDYCEECIVELTTE